jgi:WD40 repeat protein
MKTWRVVVLAFPAVLASGIGDSSLRGEEPKVLKGHTGQVRCVCFSPDGNTLASASVDGTIKLWDAAAGTEKATFKGHKGSVYCVCFSPDGKTLAAGSGDKTIVLWNVGAGK